MTVLRIRDLSVRYPNGALAVRSVGFTVDDGEIVAIVGESGCGKSSVTKAILGVLPRGTRVDGQIQLADLTLSGASEAQWRHIRGSRIGYVSQDPFGAMDPLRRIASNVAETWRIKKVNPGHRRIVDALRAVGIDRAAERSRQYPHEWSGGMLQRAEIASSTVWNPDLVVADEPTAALDAELADVIVTGLREAARSVLLISHDLALVERHAERVLVMYGGRIVEAGPVDAILRRPRHPYTIGLLAAVPRPGRGLPIPLEGAPPDLSDQRPGCPFAPRCPIQVSACWAATPPFVDGLACPEVSR